VNYQTNWKDYFESRLAEKCYEINMSKDQLSRNLVNNFSDFDHLVELKLGLKQKLKKSAKK
jgi:hypothetical protein